MIGCAETALAEVKSDQLHHRISQRFTKMPLRSEMFQANNARGIILVGTGGLLSKSPY